MPSSIITLDSDIFKCCHRVETLGWSNDALAKSLLQRAADQVKPIMAHHKWAVPLLNEFYPATRNLLGVNHNHGQRIQVRLRSPSNRDRFLRYETILGTLLHELVHIQIGPHNAPFYKLLDELNHECDQLIAHGSISNILSSSSLSTFGRGTQTGTRLSTIRPPPKYIAKERAVHATQKRNRINRLMIQSGGRKLGGNSELAQISTLCDPREMAVAAAERRLADELWCSSASSETRTNSTITAPITESYPKSNNTLLNADPIDVDAVSISPNDDNHFDDDEVIFVAQTKSSIPRQHKNIPRRPPPRISPSSIPVREHPTALAALQRAQDKDVSHNRR